MSCSLLYICKRYCVLYSYIDALNLGKSVIITFVMSCIYTNIALFVASAKRTLGLFHENPFGTAGMWFDMRVSDVHSIDTNINAGTVVKQSIWVDLDK